MGLFYQPPGVYLGGQQPYDGRKGALPNGQPPTPTPGVAHHAWHVGSTGIKTTVKDKSDVDSDPPST